MTTKWLKRNKKKIRKLYPDCVVYGPYTNSKDGRRRIVLYNGIKRTAKQYAKLKMEVLIGRILTKYETVDHIDRNFLNDRYSNLQILNKKLHASKDALKRKEHMATCVWCGSKFKLSKEQVNKRSQRKAGPFCSRSCSSSYGANIQNGGTPIKRKVVKIIYEYR